MTRGDKRNILVGLAFISPWVIGFIVFTLYPLCASAYYSLCDYDVLSKPIFIGALNYRDMVTDGVFWKSLSNTLYFAAFSLPLGMVLALLIALLLNQSVKGKGIFRTMFFMPSMVPAVAVG